MAHFDDPAPDSSLMRSARFRKERENDWQRLTTLLQRIESRGIDSLSYQETVQLSALYRLTTNSLSLAREITLDQALLTYLENLCTRAYLIVYAPQSTFFDVVARFFCQSGPQAVRRSWLAILFTFLLMLFSAWGAYWLTMIDSNWYYSFVPEGLSSGRGPQASAAYLREALYNESSSNKASLTAFASYLFSHNTQVAIFSFALGIIAGIPTAFLILYNGAILGAFAAVHSSKGLGLDLFAWLSIHGVTELSAIILASAGGLRLGGALLFPGQVSRNQALRATGHDAVKLAILAGVMLLVAGILEAFARQLITDLYARIIIGWSIGLLWLVWILCTGRKKQKKGDKNVALS